MYSVSIFIRTSLIIAVLSVVLIMVISTHFCVVFEKPTSLSSERTLWSILGSRLVVMWAGWIARHFALSHESLTWFCMSGILLSVDVDQVWPLEQHTSVRVWESGRSDPSRFVAQ